MSQPVDDTAAAGSVTSDAATDDAPEAATAQTATDEEPPPPDQEPPPPTDEEPTPPTDEEPPPPDQEPTPPTDEEPPQVPSTHPGTAGAEPSDAGAGTAEPSDAGAETPEEAPAEGGGATGAPTEGGRAKRKAKGKRAGQPELRPQDVVARVGDTNERALAYVLSPDAKLSRMSRKVRDALISELPAVTAGALLGPAALARHFVASAASGRYRDLFALWELFSRFPSECKPVLAERPQALDRARNRLATAVRLGLAGRAERVAADIAVAEGLIWQWMREALVEALPAVAHRPAIASALLRREPDLDVPLPGEPGERWLGEAAAARAAGPLAPPVERVLAANADRLPGTIATLALAHEHYPDQVPGLIERVDLDGPEIGSILAWARDHGYSERIRQRAQELVNEAAEQDRADALARWQAWRERGVDLALPEPLLDSSLEGLDLGRPETAVLIARLVADGADISPQAELDAVAQRNRQLGEKAFEAFVCAGLDVTLPKPLAQNPIVRDGTRCPYCLAWTWVRPGHERRCPQRTAEPAFAVAASGAGPSAAPAPSGAAPSGAAPSGSIPNGAVTEPGDDPPGADADPQAQHASR